jgi:hypothetical protein
VILESKFEAEITEVKNSLDQSKPISASSPDINNKLGPFEERGEEEVGLLREDEVGIQLCNSEMKGG